MSSSVTEVPGFDIPGFQIQRELGRGGMAKVYLAVQRKFGRLVALKVVTGEHTHDAHFKERFIRESRINARLTHPNIVQVYDVGTHESALYLVLEYVRGGDLNQRLQKGMQLSDLVSVVKDIGRALDYAHGKGFIHRDIKPENILFREDGSAVLTDFGIARLTDSEPSLTRAGTVVGTPQYMSPEQASGKELDGRSDIYSLGVVLYRMLTGDVPYKADSAVSIGIKHLQEPVPRLPNYLQAFQGVIDRCLAKRRDQRFQTGSELIEALDGVQSEAELPNATIRAQAVSTQEVRAVGNDLLTTARDSGRIDRHSERRRRQRRMRVLVTLLIFTSVLSGVGYLMVERPPWTIRLLTIAGLIEDPMIQEAWSNAQSLHQDPNQGLSAVVAAYQRVQDLEPEHVGATTAVAGLANQWRLAFSTALAQNDLDQAETKLSELAGAFPDDPELVSLRNSLVDRRRAESLLASTQALLRSHGLSDIPSATAAIQAYREVLRLAPAHPVAERELDSLAEHYAGLATEAAADGMVDNALNFLDRASAANAELPLLDDVRDRIRRATTLQAAIADMLQQAGELRAAGTLINPPGENAAEVYHRVLAADPDNAVAAQGIIEVESQIISRTNQLIALGDIAGVYALVDRSGAVGLAPETIAEVQGRLDVEVSRLASIQTGLEQAQLLMAQGFLTAPQGGNAVAVLREIQRLDPGNEQAETLLQGSAERLAAVAQEAFDVGMAEEARQYLELALTVTPDVSAWRELRATWDEDVSTP
jgi:serine/threonine protein kinase